MVSVRILEQHVTEHPLVVHHRRTGDGRARKISDVLSQRRFDRLGLYNEFCRQVRVEHWMAVTVPARGRWSSGSRSTGAGPTSPSATGSSSTSSAPT